MYTPYFKLNTTEQQEYLQFIKDNILTGIFDDKRMLLGFKPLNNDVLIIPKQVDVRIDTIIRNSEEKSSKSKGSNSPQIIAKKEDMQYLESVKRKDAESKVSDTRSWVVRVGNDCRHAEVGDLTYMKPSEEFEGMNFAQSIDLWDIVKNPENNQWELVAFVFTLVPENFLFCLFEDLDNVDFNLG
jgi:hypothetical protein